MKSSMINQTEKLTPVLSETEKQEMAAYYTVYEKYAEEFYKKATADLQDHLVFGKVIEGSLKEVAAADSKLLTALQKDAIIDGNWGAYIEYQIAQGIKYAKTGLDFKSLHEVIVQLRNYMIPLLQKEYGDGEALLLSLNGMNRFIDIGIGITAEVYFEQKQGIIEEERNKTKILNEALEEKVIEGTAQLKRNIEQLNEYKYFFNNNDLCSIANIDGYFEIVNDKFVKTLGYSEKELCEKAFIDFVHPDDIPATLDVFEQLKAGAVLMNFVNRYRKKDGSFVYLEWYATPNPATQKLYCVARDITERKKMEEQLVESEEKFRNLINFSPAGISITNAQGKILEANRALLDMLGFESIEEIINTPASEFYVDKKERTQLIELFKMNGEVKNFEVRLKKKNGELIWIKTYLVPFKMPDGEKVLLSTSINITDRKKAEEEILVVSKRLAVAANAGGVGIWDLDILNNKLIWDEQMYLLYGLTEQSFSGAYEAWIEGLHPEDVERCNNEFQTAITDGSRFISEFRIVRPDSTIHYIYGTADVEKDGDGKAVRIIGTNWDITDNKKAEAKLISAIKDLESFSYSISHDLRSPLRAITGFADILYEDYGSELDAEGVKTLKVIRDSSKKMGQLIDALLEFSKLARRGLSDSKINMMKLVSTLREDVIRRESGITEFIIDELPDATGDIEMIKQVWIDLLSNAIKFSKQKPETRIEIGSYYQDNLIVYYVKDNGAGFDMLYYDKLFGVFQRLHSQEEFAGIGIGLSVVEKVITRHGGTVWAESKVNEGSCFYFSLPNINLQNENKMNYFE